MITQWFVDMFAGILDWIVGLFGEWELDQDSWFGRFDSMMQDILQWSNGLGVWVDWTLINTVLGAVFLTWSIVLGVRVGRVLVSHFSGGGGAV